MCVGGWKGKERILKEILTLGTTMDNKPLERISSPYA